MAEPVRKHPSPWLFVLTGMPYGVVGSFAGSVMPYLTKRAHISLDTIGWFGLLLLVPPMFQFLYAPVIDLGPRRKHWLLIVTVIGAACLVIACTMPLPEQTTAFLVFALAAQLISGLVGACNGALLATTMPDGKRGKASGALNIGNLSGGGISAAIAIYLTGHDVEPLYIGLTLAAMMIIPALAVLTVDEPIREPATAREIFGNTMDDVASVLFSKKGITGIALCISPVGTAALANYFSAMASDYFVAVTEAQKLHMANVIASVSGLANVGLTAVGALIGGFLCDRFNRRAMYLLSGALTAACGLAMMVSPRTELTYEWGVMLYALITGFCYAAFTAAVLDTIGEGGKAAATQYSLFVAAGNAAIAYVGFADTRFNDRYGVEGVIASDAGLNILGVIVLGIVFWKLGAFGKRALDNKAAMAPADPGVAG